MRFEEAQQTMYRYQTGRMVNAQEPPLHPSLCFRDGWIRTARVSRRVLHGSSLYGLGLDGFTSAHPILLLSTPAKEATNPD